MRLFNAEIFDEHLEDPAGAGSGAISSVAWACLLARAETLRFTFLVDGVTGSPTLVVALIGSNADGYYQETEKYLYQNTVSSSTTIAATYSSTDVTYPPPRHLFVEALVFGAGTKLHIKVWVCGRGPQLLEPIPITTATFANQYAAARMIDDEDHLAGRKQVLKQGASLFYPPELILPSQKWER